MGEQATLPDDEALMGIVLQHCEEALERGDCPVAAIVVRNGLAVGLGSNRVATRGDPTAHAEECEAMRQRWSRWDEPPR